MKQSTSTDGVWAALINQCGSLVYVAAYALVLQYIYSTYIDHKPEGAWLMIAWRRYVKWLQRREQRRIGWINDPRTTDERSFVHGS